ncbi:MAG: SCP2 sterol-binding domain-containing protein [Alphaproteobacteria bacterium]|nr:SCP2 sterol-binding domain-containing protein [Alphaproteobacteria bacterium]
MSLDAVEEGFKENLHKMEDLDAKVAYDFGDDGLIFIDATVSPPTIGREDEGADCTLKISIDNFIKLTDGDLDPIMAFTMGKLKVEGNMGIAMKLSSIMND